MSTLISKTDKIHVPGKDIEDIIGDDDSNGVDDDAICSVDDSIFVVEGTNGSADVSDIDDSVNDSDVDNNNDDSEDDDEGLKNVVDLYVVVGGNVVFCSGVDVNCSIVKGTEGYIDENIDDGEKVDEQLTDDNDGDDDSNFTEDDSELNDNDNIAVCSEYKEDGVGNGRAVVEYPIGGNTDDINVDNGSDSKVVK